MTSTQLLLASPALALDREIIIHIRLYLAAGWDVSEGEADVPEVLVVLLVPLHVLPLADGLGEVHHAQGDLDLRQRFLVSQSQQHSVSPFNDFYWI